MAQTRDGGKPNVKQLPYSPPNPSGVQHRNAVGLGGQNFGNSGTQDKSSIPVQTSGSPGLKGSNHGKGTNR